MKYSQAVLGRVFVLRLEDGDVVHECIENFAAENDVHAAAVVMLGGADSGSRLVTGPEQGRAEKIVPMISMLEDVYEAAGVGTVFPDESGKTVLHMHMACGRKDDSVTGCVRAGVKVWHVMEAVVIELSQTDAKRVCDSQTGFALLEP
ncbi:MAG: DNA-binding protein [Desulfobacteraceae bacterium]|nr:DNA-binding protein [Desulfobacteraceae bacterium]